MRAIGLGKVHSVWIPHFHALQELNRFYYSTAARCYELMLQRTFERSTFSKPLHSHGSIREMIADSATDLESARLLTLSCAEEMDKKGNKLARDKIAMIKVVVPQLTSKVVDRAVQVHSVGSYSLLLLHIL